MGALALALQGIHMMVGKVFFEFFFPFYTVLVSIITAQVLMLLSALPPSISIYYSVLIGPNLHALGTIEMHLLLVVSLSCTLFVIYTDVVTALDYTGRTLLDIYVISQITAR